MSLAALTPTTGTPSEGRTPAKEAPNEKDGVHRGEGAGEIRYILQDPKAAKEPQSFAPEPMSAQMSMEWERMATMAPIFGGGGKGENEQPGDATNSPRAAGHADSSGGARERTRKRQRMTSPTNLKGGKAYHVNNQHRPAAQWGMRGAAGAQESSVPPTQEKDDDDTPKQDRPPPPYLPMQVDEEPAPTQPMQQTSEAGLRPGGAAQATVESLIQAMKNLASDLRERKLGSFAEEANYMPCPESVGFLMTLANGVKDAYEGRMARLWQAQQVGLVSATTLKHRETTPDENQEEGDLPVTPGMTRRTLAHSIWNRRTAEVDEEAKEQGERAKVRVEMREEREER